MQLNTRADAQTLLDGGFSDVIMATGVAPRRASFPGHEDPRVVSYVDVLSGKVKVGNKVAVIGAGALLLSM